MSNITFSILITTRNRLEDLKITLEKTTDLLKREDVECLIYDDGSTDDTLNFLKNTYPKITLFNNPKPKGLIYNRTVLLNSCKGKYAVSIDDDLNFLTENPLGEIETYFEENPKSAVLSFRIFWSKEEPSTYSTDEKPVRVKSFAGGANCFRVAAWKAIPNFPAWFVFYGEEDFASYHLFKKSWEVHYLPSVLTHHRVNLSSRKNNNDYIIRQRRSLRSGWYLIGLFYPVGLIPKELIYSLWIQLKTKVFKGNFKALLAIVGALIDLLFHIPKILRNRNGLSKQEFAEYKKLEETKIYWKPEE